MCVCEGERENENDSKIEEEGTNSCFISTLK